MAEDKLYRVVGLSQPINGIRVLYEGTLEEYTPPPQPASIEKLEEEAVKLWNTETTSAAEMNGMIRLWFFVSPKIASMMQEKEEILKKLGQRNNHLLQDNDKKETEIEKLEEQIQSLQDQVLQAKDEHIKTLHEYEKFMELFKELQSQLEAKDAKIKLLESSNTASAFKGDI
jgi:predicted nuclease with TOPRIM domain